MVIMRHVMALKLPRQQNTSATAARGARSGTKHSELTAALREMVAQMRPGDRLPTQEELMRRFEVSDTTVLRSLGDLRREGRIVRRQGSGTFVADAPPDENALPETRKRSMVAVLVSQSGNLFFSEMIQTVEAGLVAHGMSPVLIMDRAIDKRFQRAVEHWERGDVVGAIHIGTAPLSGLRGMPAVLIGESDDNHEFCQVSLDSHGAGRRIGEFLWDLGHRHVAVVMIQPARNKPLTQGVDHLRVAGIRSLWEERGGVWNEEAEIAHPQMLRPDDGPGVSVMRSYLEPLFHSPEPPTAIFAAHDEMATVTIRALEEMGLCVPDDVSVIGFNDLGMLASYFRPALTTVRTPAATLGSLAVHQLLDLLNHSERKPRSIRLPAEIIVRESTAPPPGKTAARNSVVPSSTTRERDGNIIAVS